jgi:hypothetical protein
MRMGLTVVGLYPESSCFTSTWQPVGSLQNCMRKPVLWVSKNILGNLPSHVHRRAIHTDTFHLRWMENMALLSREPMVELRDFRSATVEVAFRRTNRSLPTRLSTARAATAPADVDTNPEVACGNAAALTKSSNSDRRLLSARRSGVGRKLSKIKHE